MILTALLLLSSPQATEPEVDCKDPMTQMAMNICAGRDYEAADRKLNAVWKKVSAEMKQLEEQADEASEEELLRMLEASLGELEEGDDG